MLQQILAVSREQLDRQLKPLLGFFEPLPTPLSPRAYVPGVVVGDYLYYGPGKSDIGYETDFVRLNVKTLQTEVLADVPMSHVRHHFFKLEGYDDYIWFLLFQTISPHIRLWRYSISGDIWTEMAPYPGVVDMYSPNACAIGSKIYGCFAGLANDFYEYDPDTNTWNAKANRPTAYHRAYSLTTDGTYLYVLGGGKVIDNVSMSYVEDFYKYDPIADTWIQLKSAQWSIFNRQSYFIARIFYFHGYIWAFEGEQYAVDGLRYSYFPILYRYDISKDEWVVRPKPFLFGVMSRIVELFCTDENYLYFGFGYHAKYRSNELFRVPLELFKE